MSLRCPVGQGAGLVCASFNQDGSCVALGTLDGIRVYNIDSHQICYRFDVGAIGIAQMLFCTSLIAYVGAGEQPALTPRKVTVWNTSAQRAIQDLPFPSSVLAVHLNRQRLVALLAHQAQVFALHDLSHQCSIDTPLNHKALAALTTTCAPTLLALPADSGAGVVRVWDLLAGTEGSVVAEVQAHQSPLQALAWSADGALLATASATGTVIRVYRLPSAQKVFTFRRGTRPATLTSLSFSPAAIDPPLLAASSSHGTVHIFRCAHPGQQHPALAAASAAAGLLSAVMSLPLSDMVEPQRNIARIPLPCGRAAPTLCALRCPPHSPSSSSPGGHAGGAPDSISIEDAVMLAVVSGEGLLYEYLLEDLTGPSGPHATLSNEVALLGASHINPG